MLTRGVNSITLKNDCGETIEVRRSETGAVEVKHSDIGGADWLVFRETNVVKDDPRFLKILKSKGIDPGSTEYKLALEMGDSIFGGAYLVQNGKTYNLNADEVGMIREAITQLG